MSKNQRTRSEQQAYLVVFDAIVDALIEERMGLDRAIARRASVSDDVWVRHSALLEYQIGMMRKREEMAADLPTSTPDVVIPTIPRRSYAPDLMDVISEALDQFVEWLDSKLVYVTPYEGEPTNASNMLGAYRREMNEGQE